MQTKIIIAISTILLFVGSAALAQDSDNYCRYVQETAKANDLRLRMPSTTAGVTQPNTGTQPQIYSGLTGSLADYRKGYLTIEVAKENCSLYRSTSEAQQAIQYAASYLEQQALRHRIIVIEDALQKLDQLVDQNVLMIQAQSATKFSLYGLQTAKARLITDKITAQRGIATRFIPELPNAPLSRLIAEKQADEDRNQRALAKVARQENWDIQWNAGYHRTLNNSPGELASPSGAYVGFTALYNLDSQRINRHLDAAAQSYLNWKRDAENDVTQNAANLRLQIIEAIQVEQKRLVELRQQRRELDKNLNLVQNVSTSTGVTFFNQLTADRLGLDVETQDSEFRLAGLRDYLAYNFSDTPATEGKVSITFDDGFKSALRAVPILDKAGIKATWYIITRALNHDTYMSTEDVKMLAAMGQEIGAHTRTHPHLPTLTLAQQEDEISGSIADLATLGLHPVSFAYPYGEHNEDSLAAVQKSGFKTARTTDRTISRNPYLLQGFSITSETQIEDIERAIQTAQRNGEWLILTFHKIDEDGSISASHELVQQIVDYLIQNKIKVTTVGGN